jgi:serine/threonine protein kinase
MILAAGTRLGPYEILSPLGAGGMGEVYKASDTRLDRTVAIKILPADMAADVQRRERFRREARAISSLTHASICTLHDVAEQDGVDFLVMEYLPGETLAHRLLRGALPLEDVLRIGVQFADALDAAYRAGLTHRDLKPANVMLTAGGAKVLDFGLAKWHAHEADSGISLAQAAVTAHPTLTQAGTVVGTIQYMAPEQVEGRAADARSDLFALGAIIYEMTTGRKAFEGTSATSVMAAILQSTRPNGELCGYFQCLAAQSPSLSCRQTSIRRTLDSPPTVDGWPTIQTSPAGQRCTFNHFPTRRRERRCPPMAVRNLDGGKMDENSFIFLWTTR